MKDIGVAKFILGMENIKDTIKKKFGSTRESVLRQFCKDLMLSSSSTPHHFHQTLENYIFIILSL